MLGRLRAYGTERIKRPMDTTASGVRNGLWRVVLILLVAAALRIHGTAQQGHRNAR